MIEEICNLLIRTRFNYSNEAELQLGVAELLTQHGHAFDRERILDASSRIDFYFRGGLGLECKVDGGPSEILRQVQRYMTHPDVSALILLSRRQNVRVIPDVVCGKPVRIVTLWSSGL